MSINPSDILPRRPVPEIAMGPVVSVGVGSVSVRVRPDLTVLVSTQTPTPWARWSAWRYLGATSRRRRSSAARRGVRQESGRWLCDQNPGLRPVILCAGIP
jgi:hypothetical protein